MKFDSNEEARNFLNSLRGQQGLPPVDLVSLATCVEPLGLYIVNFISFMIILAWNTRGLGSKCKRREVRNVVRRYKCNYLILCETKLDSLTSSLTQSIRGEVKSLGISTISGCFWGNYLGLG